MSSFRLRGLLLIVLVPLVFLAPNAGAVSTSLVINEVDYDQASTDTAEFLELKNLSGAALSLNGFSVELFNGASTVNATYRTIALPNTTLAAGDYFVICSNPATTLNCDLDGGPDTDLIQNGAPDAIGLRNAGTLVDAVSYEGNSAAPYTEGSGVGLVDDPDAGVAGLSRCPDGSDTDQNSVDFRFATSTPGAANTCPPPPNPAGACGDPATLISVVQGADASSPLVGQQHTIEGVIIGDFDGTGGLNGYFVQEQDADRDTNAATSEGIFVSHVSTTTTIGDLVRVRGTVSEPVPSGSAPPNSMTRLGTVTGNVKCSSGHSVSTTDVSLPAPSPTNGPAAYEPLEGMQVRLPQALVISEYFNYDRFGEIVLGLPVDDETRHFTPTSILEPGAPANARFAEYLRRRITLDDGLGVQNPEFTRHPNGAGFSLDNSFRGGDKVGGTVGVLSWDFNLWRIQPTGPATYTAVNERPGPLESVDGIRVATMNTLNYFLTLDIEPNSPPSPLDNKCGPAQNVECRGADSNQPDEFNRQHTKLLAALSGLDADVIGLNELENTTDVDPLEDPAKGIVPGLNAMPGVGPYDAIDTDTIGGDAIKVGLIYRTGVVRPVGDHKVLTRAVDPRFIDTLSRPVLAQTFEVIATGARFTVAVNHLKSKGSACPGDPDIFDGQGNCNQTRKAAAQALVDWLATDPTGSDDPDFLIMGDLNSYAKEDPIDVILAGPDDTPGTGDDYTNLVEKYEGRFAYSFVFDGQAGYLDHGLANSAVVDQVLGATEWHINADEPDLVDYDTSFKSATQDTFYEPNQFRSADHDPLVVTLCAELTSCATDRLAEVADDLEALRGSASGRTRARLGDVLEELEQALARLSAPSPNRSQAARDAGDAASELQAAVQQGLVSASQANPLLDRLTRAMRLLAVDAIEEAKARDGDATTIDEAEKDVAKGDTRRVAGQFKNAISSYRDAIVKAEGA